MSSTAPGTLPLVAVTYSGLHTEDPPLLLAEGARDTCRLAWVLPDAGAVSRGAARMLRGLGEIIDVTGLTPHEAAEHVRASGAAGITCFNDSNLVWTAAIADILGFAFFSPLAAVRLTDKLEQRRALAQHGLATPRFWDADELSDESARSEVGRTVGFPVVLKPRRGRSSADVEAVRSQDELRSALSRVSPGRMLVESYIPDPTTPPTNSAVAPYVSVELAVSRGQAVVLGVTGKTPLAPPFRETGQLFPADLPDALRQELAETAISSARALGVETGALHIEIKCTDDGPVVIEANGCMGGGPLRDLMIAVIGVDLVQLSYRLAAGDEVSLAHATPASGVGFHFEVQPDPSVRHIETIEGLDTLADIPGVERVVPGLQPGDDFDWRTGSHAFAATILGTAPDHATALRIRDEFISRVVITGRP